MDEITPDILASLASGDLGPEESAALRARIAADAGAAERLAETERLVAFLRDEGNAVVSRSAINAALGMFASSRPGLIERAAEGVRTFIAALDFDSRFSPAIAGFRGAAEVSQAAYSCGACEVDLELQPEVEGRFAVRGQITPLEHEPPSAPGVWSLSFVDRKETVTERIDSDTEGMFRVSVEPGVYTILLERDGVRVKLGPFPIP